MTFECQSALKEKVVADRRVNVRNRLENYGQNISLNRNKRRISTPQSLLLFSLQWRTQTVQFLALYSEGGPCTIFLLQDPFVFFFFKKQNLGHWSVNLCLSLVLCLLLSIFWWACLNVLPLLVPDEEEFNHRAPLNRSRKQKWKKQKRGDKSGGNVKKKPWPLARGVNAGHLSAISANNRLQNQK